MTIKSYEVKAHNTNYIIENSRTHENHSKVFPPQTVYSEGNTGQEREGCTYVTKIVIFNNNYRNNSFVLIKMCPK